MLAFSAGADLSLVVRSRARGPKQPFGRDWVLWSLLSVKSETVRVRGFVIATGAKRIACGGWNYFMPSGAPQP